MGDLSVQFFCLLSHIKFNDDSIEATETSCSSSHNYVRNSTPDMNTQAGFHHD